MLKTFLNYVNQRSIADRLQSLKTLISGGEPLPKSTADMCMSLFEKNPQFELINAYGPTETTVAVTLYSDPGNEISEETQITIESLIEGYFHGLSKDNISINIESTEK